MSDTKIKRKHIGLPCHESLANCLDQIAAIRQSEVNANVPKHLHRKFSRNLVVREAITEYIERTAARLPDGTLDTSCISM
jgi:hypothetical protein